jgi:thiamine biosynthesis protein ThiS
MRLDAKVNSQAITIDIQVNGEGRQVPGDQSVAALLTWLEVASERVAVELNRTLVRKRDWDRTVVPNGALLEIVEFVGGG